jgi:phosphate starvation-inducible PhoH-like protein
MAKKIVNGDYFKLSPTKLQKEVINFLRSYDIAIIEGEAGTGKDFCSMYYALLALKEGNFEKILISKPAVEAGKSIGFLPGTKDDKLSVYMKSILNNCEKLIGVEEVRKLLNAEKIVFESIGFSRGDTYDNSIIILTEAQNCTLHELITFTTRVSSTSKLILNGDTLQADIKNSGFKKFIELFKNIDEIGYKLLSEEYQMRSEIITKINRIYRNYLKKDYESRNASKMEIN